MPLPAFSVHLLPAYFLTSCARSLFHCNWNGLCVSLHLDSPSLFKSHLKASLSLHANTFNSPLILLLIFIKTSICINLVAVSIKCYTMQWLLQLFHKYKEFWGLIFILFVYNSVQQDSHPDWGIWALLCYKYKCYCYPLEGSILRPYTVLSWKLCTRNQ